MTHGLDSGYLIAVELIEHPDHLAARAAITRLVASGDVVAIAPQALTEFIHVATDLRRFSQPLDMQTARLIAEQWWTASDIVQVFPSDAAVRQFLTWIERFSLGRKRLLDTFLAATYEQVGIRSILTTNAADFAVYGVFSCIAP